MPIYKSSGEHARPAGFNRTWVRRTCRLGVLSAGRSAGRRYGLIRHPPLYYYPQILTPPPPIITNKTPPPPLLAYYKFPHPPFPSTPPPSPPKPTCKSFLRSPQSPPPLPPKPTCNNFLRLVNFMIPPPSLAKSHKSHAAFNLDIIPCSSAMFVPSYFL